ncbi:MAG: thioredoxin family protein [Bacteroidetes bacterium]|nr:thioredoxin family protein [Bacteroidota bacterium]MBU1578457.1 thioredoxin family protein [Bacteroidota bacterium]MBU2466691.1 thioredoxin family protein [Bacteroidota bacterium]MBU2558965.1 thioredoxin family protein [Bacteroidota bacterium]
MKKLMLLFLFFSFSGIVFAQGYEIGDKAADFNLLNVDGTYVSMADYPDAKGFIVIFTCNHCPYSVAYEGRKIALAKQFAPQGYPVIAINPNDSTIVPLDSYSNMIKRADEKSFPYPYLLDADQSVFQRYGATRTPHVFLLNKEAGGLIVRYIGAIDNNYENADEATEHYVEDAIRALKDGDLPNPDFTKAIGCTIKIKKS